ncbi:MAG: hypothetical protein WCF03_00805 [Nitrososphaeraceae archaeon]
MFSVIPARCVHEPIRRTCGRYTKQINHGYSKLLYGQRDKDETIVSVFKRLFGEYITSSITSSRLTGKKRRTESYLLNA